MPDVAIAEPEPGQSYETLRSDVAALIAKPGAVTRAQVARVLADNPTLGG